MNRIEILLEKRNQRVADFFKMKSPKEDNLYYAFFTLYKDEPLHVRQAKSIVYGLHNEPLHIFPEDKIVGRIYQGVNGEWSPFLASTEKYPEFAEYCVFDHGIKEFNEMSEENMMFSKAYGDWVIPGHVAWSWNIIVEKGVKCFKEEIIEKYLNKTDNKDAKEFYNGVVTELQGVEDWINNICKRLEDLIKTDNNPNYTYMLENCKASLYPAKSFKVAVQAFMLQYMAVMFESPHGGNGPGRLDKYLWPYLEKDLNNGVITRDEAYEIIQELFILMDERINRNDGWVETVVVGGSDETGKSIVNPLSYMMVEAFMELKQTHPAVYMSMPDNAPDDYLELAARYMLEGQNRAQVFGDSNIIKALVKDGVDPKDAHNYYAGGCMEIAIQGKQGDMLFSYIINVPKALEVVLNGGKFILTGQKASPIDKTLCDYETFDDLYKAFEKEYTRQLGIIYGKVDHTIKYYGTYKPVYLLSSMVEDCLGRGKSLCAGGEVYANYGGAPIGIPNVGDSLYAIKKACYDDKRFTKEELLTALRDNFIGHEELQVYLMNLPKYGGNNEEATQMTNKVLGIHNKFMREYTTLGGGHGVNVILGFTFTASEGEVTGATADGRGAKAPFAQGLSPQNGACVNGITGAFNDAVTLDLDDVAGGASMMWDIDPNWATVDIMKALIKSYVSMGGHIFQGNVMNKKILLDAMKEPDKYKDLMVRVGGFSAKFVTLGKCLQEEIINRYEHAK